MGIADTIIPKSDQINADDMIAGPRTIRITGVDVKVGVDQPVSVSFHGDNGKPYKPCKSMRRVMATLWGLDEQRYVGRSLTLYRDDAVRFGKDAVGGIRISHMSHIDADASLPLTVTRGQRKPYSVKKLSESGDAISKQTIAEYEKLLGKVEASIAGKAREYIETHNTQSGYEKMIVRLSDEIKSAAEAEGASNV